MTEEKEFEWKKELVTYTIIGKIKKDDKESLPGDLPIIVYATRDRKVLGSSPVSKDGRFEIKYKYKSSGRNKEPIGTYIIIGPRLPDDQILKTKLSKKFLSSKGFKKERQAFVYEKTDVITLSKIDIADIKDSAKLYAFLFTYTGYIMTCSPLILSHTCPLGCANPGSLSTSDHRVYVRLSSGGKIIADDLQVSNGSESDESIPGGFSVTKTYFVPPFFGRTALVEVYQKIGGITNPLYSGNLTFEHNLPQYICIDRDAVNIIEIPEPEGAGAGNSFGFTRVGNIPTDYINPSTGFADSSSALDNATWKVKDFAFSGELHLYANIGEDLLIDGATGECKIKYFRVKYTHLDTGIDGYIQTCFSNSREPRAGEGIDSIPEIMGPLPASDTGGKIGVYRYANPYENEILYPGKEINDWVFKGLLMVIYPSSLPYIYGKYILTVEPLDSKMDPVVVSGAATNDYTVELVLLIDNDLSALSGNIKDIMGTGACGFMDKKSIAVGVPFGIEVEFDINNSRGTLRDFLLSAAWGENGYVGLADGKYPTYVGTTPITAPYWHGESGIKATKNSAWVQCAYQFRLEARRRVTTGFSCEPWITVFTKHITILSNNTYI